MSGFRWQAWPTHFKVIWQVFGADGSEWGMDYRRFGQAYHCGVDIKSGLYGEVMAVADGVVLWSKFDESGLGLQVRVDHDERFATVYGHLSRLFVTSGQRVKAGEVLGWSGWTGNTSGDEQHLHVGQIDGAKGDPGCYRRYVDPEPFYRHLLAPAPEPEGVDLVPYLCGDGRAYRTRSTQGDEVMWTEHGAPGFYQVKNNQWEHLWYDDDFIYRGIDTSPGDGRFYAHYAGGSIGAPWVARYMDEGDRFVSRKRVQFFRKEDCRPLDENSGEVTDTIVFTRHYDKWTTVHGVQMSDVIELTWAEGNERYLYARNFGLVGWYGHGHYMGLLEPVPMGMPRERLPCAERLTSWLTG